MKKIITIALLVICTITQAQTKKPATVSIGKFTIGTVLKDTLVTNYETSSPEREMKEVRSYAVPEYKPNQYIALTNFKVLTFKGLIISITFDFNTEVQAMLEAKYKVNFDSGEIQDFISPVKTINIFLDYETDTVYIIDEAGMNKIKALKYKGI